MKTVARQRKQMHDQGALSEALGTGQRVYIRGHADWGRKKIQDAWVSSLSSGKST